ncbi:MAG: hypothetical protein ABI741_14775 [Ferruginibacter sp.]
MEDLIELYLFKNKKCPLPSLGVLQVVDTNAVALYSQGKIEPPIPSIKLLEQELPADGFIDFIALKKNISTDEASALLTQYCYKLQNMDAYGETKFPNAGKFYVNSDGNLVFRTVEIPKAFLPELTVERVIHPAASHAMVVGDRETTTTEMAAYYSDTDPSIKDKWWIWAICLAAIGAALLFFHFKDQNHAAAIGNSQPIEISPVLKTYSIAE